MFLVKTDHELNAANRLTLRYNHQNFTGDDFENGGAQNALEHTGESLREDAHVQRGVDERDQRDAVQRGARASARATRSRARPTARTRKRSFSRAGPTVLTIGRNNFSPRETTIKRWQVADTLTMVRGAHKLKGGFDFQFDDILNYFPGFFSGSYTFSSLASFAGGRPNGANESYQQNFAGAGHDRRGDPSEHPGVSRCSRRTSGGRRAT